MMLKEYISLLEALKLGKESKTKLEIVKRVDELNVLYSVGKLSAEKIVAPKSFPSENRSAVDGFALASRFALSASASNIIDLDIVGESTPDSPFRGIVKDGEAVRVLTGARIPDGTDAVITDEEVMIDGNKLKVPRSLRPFQNVSIIGEDLVEGSIIAERGDIIDPPKLVAMIETGIKSVKTLEIRAGVLSTGDEIIKGKVKNSTQYFLLELLRENGYVPVNLGVAADNVDDIYSKVNVDNLDIIIITGGTGPGDKDVTSKFVEANGEIIFHGIKIRPGRTTGLGIVNGVPVFMISGLPVASMIAFENLIDPLIRFWYDLNSPPEYSVNAKLSRSIVNTIGFRSFVRVKLKNDQGEYIAEPFKVTGSGIISSIMYANGIVEVPENVEGFPEGSVVKVKLLRC